MQRASENANPQGTRGLPWKASSQTLETATALVDAAGLAADGSEFAPASPSIRTRPLSAMAHLPEEVWAHMLGFMAASDYIGLLSFSLVCEAATALVEKHFAHELSGARHLTQETALRKSLAAFRRIVATLRESAATGKGAASIGGAGDIGIPADILPAMKNAVGDLCHSRTALLLPLFEVPAASRAVFLQCLFEQPNPKLVVLDLSGCLGPPDPGQAVRMVLRGALMVGAPSPRRISLKVDCDCPDFGWLLANLASNQSLTELCILSSFGAPARHVTRQVQALPDLAHAVGLNTSLRHLSIHHCLVLEDDSNALARALEINSTLVKLDVSLNRLWGNAIQIAARQSNSTLRELRLPAVSRRVAGTIEESDQAPLRNVGLRVNPTGSTVLRSFYDLCCNGEYEDPARQKV